MMQKKHTSLASLKSALAVPATTWCAFGVAMAGALGFACSSPAASPVEAPASETAKKAGTSEGTLTLTDRATTKNPIQTARAEKAKLSPDVDVVGSVAPSEDHVAIIGPLVAGRVAQLFAGLGDRVEKGQVLAYIESADVGQAQALYLTAQAQLNAAEANLRRESDLVKRRITSQREYEIAVANATTEQAELRASIEQLRAIGFKDTDIDSLAKKKFLGGRVPMRAPIAGTVIARKVTLGEAVEKATDAFQVADLSALWVLLDVYEKDLAKVQKGQKVELRTEVYPGEVFEATVAHLGNVIDLDTRTAKVRIQFGNPQGKLRIGQLVTARILGDPALVKDEVLAVPRTAIQRVEGKPLVFVKDERGQFQKRIVDVGISGGDLVEVVAGLTPGETVATDGAFLLKSELLR
jgi:cobalt-zinc-cadmium efflux system membrane fusion protein